MLTDDIKKTIKTLKGLVEICKDGQEGFKTAAENIKESEYKTIFISFASQRGMFANELEAEIRRLGADEDEKNLEGLWNEMAGAAHRGWINIKAAISKGDSLSILNECETGEDAAIKAYENALEDRSFPLAIANLIRSQYITIKEAHDRIKSLRNLERVTH